MAAMIDTSSTAAVKGRQLMRVSLQFIAETNKPGLYAYEILVGLPRDAKVVGVALDPDVADVVVLTIESASFLVAETGLVEYVEPTIIQYREWPDEDAS